MFKKSPVAKQQDIFSSPLMLMNEREAKGFAKTTAWHNEFFRNVTANIDESVFKPLFTEGNARGKDGRPNAALRILIAMMILKEGVGCSDELLFENCRYNMLYRAAVGLVNLNDKLPTEATYYNLRKAICEYEEKTGENLFDKCFKDITRKQVIKYKVSGKSIRMDSKLISSNIAWYSRYEIIVATLKKEVDKELAMKIEDQLLRQQALELLGEDAAKTVYRTSSEEMGTRLLTLGIIIDRMLAICPDDLALLRRVFNEQYTKDESGNVIVRDQKTISADSVQNPNDPDASYRSKKKQKVKGYSVNITETCDQPTETCVDEDGKEYERPVAPELIVSADVKKATASDNTYVEGGVESGSSVTGDKVENLHADGAYQSEANRRLAEVKGFRLKANGIQGKPGRYDLVKQEDGTLAVTDKQTGEKLKVLSTKKGDKWKVKVIGKDGKTSWRYFDDEAIDRCRVRREVEELSFEERKKRNNVEATIFQYCFHTRNNKTRYRGLIKHAMQAIARCAWINMRRICLFDLKIA